MNILVFCFSEYFTPFIKNQICFCAKVVLQLHGTVISPHLDMYFKFWQRNSIFLPIFLLFLDMIYHQLHQLVMLLGS